MLVATSNEGKLREIREIMVDTPYHIISLDEAVRLGYLLEVPTIVEDGNTFEDNALKKAVNIMHLSGITTLADYSGLEIDFLDGLPGVNSAYFLGADTPYIQRNQRIIEMMASTDKRSARFVCVIAVAYAGDKSTQIQRASVEGVIAHKAQGKGGFGYDPIFLVPQFGKTFAQLSMAEKNSVSHRATALCKIKAIL